MGPVELSDLKRSWAAVLDLALADADGPEVRRRLRAIGAAAVIMLTTLGAEGDPLLGLELGAVDYITNPFKLRDQMLRAQSVRSRTGGSPDPAAARTFRAGAIEVDVVAHRAERGGRPLQLTGREFDLLAFFLANPGRAFTRAELLEKVWGWVIGDQSTVTVHVRRLREKIEADPANPKLLATVWGVGYRLDPPDDSLPAPIGQSASYGRRNPAHGAPRTGPPRQRTPHGHAIRVRD
jgi:DNA-binding response OmpR family regulator